MANKTIDGMRRKPAAPTSIGVEGVRQLRARVAQEGPVIRRKVVAKESLSPRIIDEEPKPKEPIRRIVRPVSRKADREAEEDALLEAAFEGAPKGERMNRNHKQTRSDFIKPVSGFDMDLSEDEIKKDQPKKKKIIKRVLIGLLIFIVIGGVVAYFWGDAIIRKITGGRSGMGDLIGTVMTDKFVDLKTDKNGRTNILVFGTSGYTMEDETHDGAQLTDSIMAVSIDKESGDVAMISLPRDLYIGNTCTSTGKINEVYWCNNIDDTDEDSGAKALEEEVGRILNMDFQYYVHLNWGALVQIVDILGGITVTVDEDINDVGWTEIVMEAGVPRTLTGEEALGLARARHGTTSGDFTRANSQQKILIALKDKFTESNISITDAIGLLNTLGDNLRTSFSMDELKSIYNTATTIDFSAMRSVSLIDQGDGTSLVSTTAFDPSGLGYEVSFVVPAAGRYNYVDIQDYVKRQLLSDPIARENPKILVLNGTGESGVASAEKSKLEADGFENIFVDDAPEGYWEGIRIYDVTERTPGSLGKIAGKYGVATSPKVPAEINATGYDIVIIVGVDKPENNETAE